MKLVSLRIPLGSAALAASLTVLFAASSGAGDATAVPEVSLAAIAFGEAKIVDLAYPLNAESNFWPGPAYSPFHVETIATLANDGVYSRKLSFPEHIGTHLDAPNHFEADEPDVSQIPPSQFFAPGIVVDLSLRAEMDADTVLTIADLQAWEQQHGKIPEGAVVLVNTGWGRYWKTPARFQNRDARGGLHFPGYSAEAARWLLDQRRVKGIGIDTLSIDPGNSKTFDVHHIINRAQRYGLENVAELEQLPARGFFVIVAPIKVEGGTGGPCRIFAVLPGGSRE